MNSYSIFESVSRLFPTLPQRDPSQMSPLVLAYIGDTIYDLLVRSYLVERYDYTAHGMHMCAAGIVKAGAQAASLDHIMGVFTQEEEAIYKRGRNAKINTLPKNAEIGDYRAATGLEAVFGYLYLTGQDERLIELAKLALASAINE